MPKIDWHVVAYPTMRSPTRLRFDPRFNNSSVFPNRVRSIKCVILTFGAFEKVKLDKALS